MMLKTRSMTWRALQEAAQRTQLSVPLTSFYPFPSFPYELQDMTWDFAVWSVTPRLQPQAMTLDIHPSVHTFGSRLHMLELFSGPMSIILASHAAFDAAMRLMRRIEKSRYKNTHGDYFYLPYVLAEPFDSQPYAQGRKLCQYILAHPNSDLRRWLWAHGTSWVVSLPIRDDKDSSDVQLSDDFSDYLVQYWCNRRYRTVQDQLSFELKITSNGFYAQGEMDSSYRDIARIYHRFKASGKNRNFKLKYLIRLRQMNSGAGLNKQWFYSWKQGEDDPKFTGIGNAEEFLVNYQSHIPVVPGKIPFLRHFAKRPRCKYIGLDGLQHEIPIQWHSVEERIKDIKGIMKKAQISNEVLNEKAKASGRTENQVKQSLRHARDYQKRQLELWEDCCKKMEEMEEDVVMGGV